jgi:hypothetical protein
MLSQNNRGEEKFGIAIDSPRDHTISRAVQEAARLANSPI